MISFQVCMPTQSKTVILQIHPETNPEKIKTIIKITKQCTFAVPLFLKYAKGNKLYESKTLDIHRKSVEKRTELSSGFVQACCDTAKTVLKPYPDRLKSWQDKLTKIQQHLIDYFRGVYKINRLEATSLWW